MELKQYKKIVRWSAIYDLVVTLPFALPVVSGMVVQGFASLHQKFNFEGTVPAFEGSHLLFVNLLGCIVTVWSVLRIKKPEAQYGLYDSFGRFSFSAWQLYYLLTNQLTPLAWALFVPEIIWGIVQAWGYWRLKNVRK